MHARWQRRGVPQAVLQAGVGYALLATMATALALALGDGVPWKHPSPWMPMRDDAAVLLSALLGTVLAIGVIVSTRLAVTRFSWARRLHDDLRPVARDMSLLHILALAGLSSLGEELLFRGLLVPWVGVAASAVAFGLAHQMKGPSRWVWAAWATVVGAALGAIFALTGSLVGPLLAHAVVNAVNLTYLRSHDAEGERTAA